LEGEKREHRVLNTVGETLWIRKRVLDITV
jgi:hypothetical protein